MSTAFDIAQALYDAAEPADDTPTCDRCGQECGEENLTAQSNGQSICSACEFNDDD